MKQKNNNLNFKIALLQAEIGKKSNLSQCNRIIHAQKKRGKIQEDSLEKKKTELKGLLLLKQDQWKFSTRKGVNQLLKRLITLEKQKLTRNLKQVKENEQNTDENKIKQLEAQIEENKNVEVGNLVDLVFFCLENNLEMKKLAKNEKIKETFSPTPHALKFLYTNQFKTSYSELLIKWNEFKKFIEETETETQAEDKKIIKTKGEKKSIKKKSKKSDSIHEDENVDGSDSDCSDGDDDAPVEKSSKKGDSSEPKKKSSKLEPKIKKSKKEKKEKKKKNRMGQNQRKRMYEERYGKNANHKIEEYEAKREKTSKKLVDNPEELHPSWNAKLQKQKALDALKATPVASIKFDD